MTLNTSFDGRIQALQAFSVLGIMGTPEELTQLAQGHGIVLSQHNFGTGREAALSLADFVQLCFRLETLEAKRWRSKAADLLRRYLEGDIQMAAEVAERSPSAEHRRWLVARLESVESRKRLMSTVAKHGGQGSIYQQVSSLSNRSVLKMNSSELRKQRKVKNTRDGLSETELLRLSYLESATARQIERKGLRGNEQILKLHEQKAQLEQKIWEDEEAPSAS